MGVLCKTITLMAKSPTAVGPESTKGTNDERKPSMRANDSRYVNKITFYTTETCLSIFTIFLLVKSIKKNDL